MKSPKLLWYTLCSHWQFITHLYPKIYCQNLCPCSRLMPCCLLIYPPAAHQPNIRLHPLYTSCMRSWPSKVQAQSADRHCKTRLVSLTLTTKASGMVKLVCRVASWSWDDAWPWRKSQRAKMYRKVWGLSGDGSRRDGVHLLTFSLMVLTAPQFMSNGLCVFLWCCVFALCSHGQPPKGLDSSIWSDISTLQKCLRGCCV